jgi:hypothetical protein
MSQTLVLNRTRFSIGAPCAPDADRARAWITEREHVSKDALGGIQTTCLVQFAIAVPSYEFERPTYCGLYAA